MTYFHVYVYKTGYILDVENGIHHSGIQDNHEPHVPVHHDERGLCFSF